MNLLGCSAVSSLHLHLLKSPVSYEPNSKRNINSKLRFRNLVYSIGLPEAAKILLNFYF